MGVNVIVVRGHPSQRPPTTTRTCYMRW